MPIRREVKQRKFHDALLNMLYPPPPSPPQLEDIQQEEDEEVAYILPDGFNVDDQEESGSSSSSHDGLEFGQQKLTRAQRKRLRKKKLKETALQRRKIIGPLLLPSTSNEGGDILDNEPPSVRRNVTEGPNAANDELGCSHSNKLKHRRKAKRQAKERANSSNIEKISDGDCQPCGQAGNVNTPERIGMDQEKRPA